MSAETTVKHPENEPDDWDDYRWLVPLSDSRYPGQVTIRRSDTEISVSNMGFRFKRSQDARALAAALLAAADQLDAGVTFTDLSAKLSNESLT